MRCLSFSVLDWRAVLAKTWYLQCFSLRTDLAYEIHHSVTSTSTLNDLAGLIRVAEPFLRHQDQFRGIFEMLSAQIFDV